MKPIEKTLPEEVTIGYILYAMGETESENVYFEDVDEWYDAIFNALFNAFDAYREKAVRMGASTIVAARRKKKNKPFCDRCGAKEHVELHHIRPVGIGGGNEPENIAWICLECHRSLKGANKGQQFSDRKNFEKWLTDYRVERGLSV